VDGAVRRVRGGWVATGQPWSYDAERYARISAARKAEQQHMVEYETTTGCRMEFLQRSLDDDTAAPCGRCDNCAGAWYPASVDDSAMSTARSSLEKVGTIIEPRALWPNGMDKLGVPARGKIPPAERLEEGRALARLSDLGWGGTLRGLFAPGAADAPASAALIDACIRVLAGWDWNQRPVSVAAMPSRRHPQLIDSVARGLAMAGRLTYLGALSPVDGGPQGEPGGNSAYRLAGVWDRFAVPFEVPEGPVLLVDDLVDSRWSLTVAGRALRLAGASGVLPFALAVQG
jgi:ATP-dependent DNA helicase RecQ